MLFRELDAQRDKWLVVTEGEEREREKRSASPMLLHFFQVSLKTFGRSFLSDLIASFMEFVQRIRDEESKGALAVFRISRPCN